jgi:small subunit ribosomal protein S2
MKIPVIAFVDTNSDARLVDVAIPSNDDAVPAIRYMCGRLLQALEEGIQEAKTARTEETAGDKTS